MHSLKWVDDGHWVSENPIRVQKEQKVFHYRYVVARYGTSAIVDWEHSPNRVADLGLLVRGEDKRVTIEDSWEQVSLELSVMVPP